MDNLNKPKTKVYKPRKPQASAYFQCVSAHYEELENVWDDYYQYNYGFWRSYVQDVILKYLDCGDPIDPENETGLEKIARYIVRASFSQERMSYISESKSHDGIAKVIYSSKNGKIKKIFTALDWLAMLTNHIPNKGQQMIRYYGTYSNKKRGMRKKQKTDEQAFELIESNDSPKKINKNWARLIQKIYNVDPLICTKCQKEMRVVSFIEEFEVIEKILKHLGLWNVNNHDPPFKKVTNIPEFIYEYSYSQFF